MKKKVMAYAVMAALLGMSGVPAFAQAPTTVDYADMIADGKTEILVALAAVGGAVFILTAMIGGVGMARKWLLRAMKSS